MIFSVSKRGSPLKYLHFHRFQALFKRNVKVWSISLLLLCDAININLGPQLSNSLSPDTVLTLVVVIAPVVVYSSSLTNNTSNTPLLFTKPIKFVNQKSAGEEVSLSLLFPPSSPLLGMTSFVNSPKQFLPMQQQRGRIKREEFSLLTDVSSNLSFHLLGKPPSNYLKGAASFHLKMYFLKCIS